MKKKGLLLVLFICGIFFVALYFGSLGKSNEKLIILDNFEDNTNRWSGDVDSFDIVNSPRLSGNYSGELCSVFGLKEVYRNFGKFTVNSFSFQLQISREVYTNVIFLLTDGTKAGSTLCLIKFEGTGDGGHISVSVGNSYRIVRESWKENVVYNISLEFDWRLQKYTFFINGKKEGVYLFEYTGIEWFSKVIIKNDNSEHISRKVWIDNFQVVKGGGN